MERRFTLGRILALLALALPGTELRGQELTSREQDALGGLIFRNPDQERRIRQLAEDAASRLKEGRTEEGLRLLQRMLQDGEDGFYWNEEAKQFTSVRLLAMQAISRLTPEQLKIYNDIYGQQEALPLLNQAVERRDIRGLHQLAGRYFHTESGFRAVEFLAWHYYDRGEFASAASLWKELLAAPVHQERLRREHRFLAAFTAELSGQPVPAEWLEPLREGKFTFGDAEKPVAEWLRLARAYRLRQSNEGQPELTPPAVEPLWVYSLGEGEKNPFRRHLRDRMTTRFQSGESVAVAATPALAAGRAIFRDELGLTAIDLQTGKPLWRRSLATTLLPWMEQIEEAAPEPQGGRDEVSEMESRFFNSSLQNVLSTNGQLVYCIDGLSLIEPSHRRYRRRNLFDDPQRDRDFASAVNRLVALRVSDGQPAWSLGGPEKPGGDKRPLPLAGHFFLCPPLVSDELLYVVAERQGQVNLFCLESAIGRVVWSQGIAFSSLDLEDAPNRYYRLCPLALSDDLAIAATQLGLLVAVDRHTGSPRWVYAMADAEFFRDYDISEISRQSYGSPGFLHPPHVSGDRIVIMPTQSRFIHALDLRTGRRLWRVARHNPQETGYDRFEMPSGAGDEYIGGVSGETVLIVGGQRCRGLDIATGAERWTLATGLPSGRGLQSGGRFLLPLQSGRVAVIDIAAGRELGISFGQAASGDAPEIPGNLLVAGEALLSVRADRISMLPQARQRLEVLSRILAGDSDPATLLEAARLELLLGEISDAEQRLQRLLAAQPDHPEGRLLLREALYYRLDRTERLAAAEREELFGRLAPLAETPDQRMRLLQAREQVAFRERNLPALRELYRQAADLEAAAPLVQPDAEAWQYSPLVWVGARSRKLSAELSAGQLAEWKKLLLPELAAALDSDQPAEHRRQLAFWAGLPEAARLRQRLAELEIRRGHFQAAELLLLQNRGDGDRAVAAQATVTLYRLWERLRLSYEGSRLLAELRSKYADVSLPSGHTVAEELADVSPAAAAPAWLRQVERVRIGSRIDLGAPSWLARGYSSRDQTVIEAFGNPELPVAQTIRRTTETDAKGQDSVQKLRFVDELTGATLREMKLPLPPVDMQSENGHSLATSVPHHRLGHFFPLGTRESANGLSLFAAAEDEPLWSRQLPPGLNDGDLSDTWLPGPALPSCCCFQLDNQLVALEPATGRILWRRSDLDLSGGLELTRGGMFGDEQALVVLQNDSQSYIVCDSLTGQVIRRGRLPLENAALNRTLGRHLLYLEERREDGPYRLRLWDPLADKIVWQAESQTEPHYDQAESGELFLLLDNVRLVMLDPKTFQPLMDVVCDLDPKLPPIQLQVFSDAERFFVNFRQHEEEPNPFVNPIGDDLRAEQFVPAELPHQYLVGPLLAIDRETRRIRWRKDFDRPRTALTLPQWELPFLVCVSRVQLGFDAEEFRLLVEVVDRETGSLLGSAELPELYDQEGLTHSRFREPLYSDKQHRLVRAECDPAAGLLTLRFLHEIHPQEGDWQPHGLQQRITIQFDPATQRLIAP